MSEDRTIDLSVEVVGTPEEVWAAIATGPGLSAWMHHSEVEPRVGGRYAYDMGSGLNETGHVAAYEPPVRLRTEGVRWEPTNGAPPAELATEWTVEARDGGTCVVRMVMSGFGPGAAWDEEIEGMSGGMGMALESLRRHLAPGPARILAAVAVTDREKAMPFYEALFGRPADVVPMPADAEWNAGGCTLQVVQAPDRAGRSMVTVTIRDLDRWLADLAARGVPAGEVRAASVGRYAQVTDPEGNLLTLVEPG